VSGKFADGKMLSPFKAEEYAKKVNQKNATRFQNDKEPEPKKKKGKGCSRFILLAVIIIVGLILLGKFGEEKDAPQKVDTAPPTITQSEQVEQKSEEGPPPPKETAEPTITAAFTLTAPSTPSPTTPTQQPKASDSNAAPESFPVYGSSSTPPTMAPSYYEATDAGREEISMIVYVTQSGNKYHRDGCSHLRKSKIPIDLKDAIRRGYEPCSRCNPPR